MAAPKKYRPIKGLGRTLLTTSFSTNHALWLGDNHLLSVKRLPFWEEYRRFYFKDIQAVICRKTVSGLIYTIVFVLMAGLALPFLISDYTGIFWWIWAGLMVMGLVLNAANGPTCVCHIQTAVQVEKLPRLNRIKKVDRFVSVLKPLVEGVQGGAWNPAAAASVSRIGPAGRHAGDYPVKPETGLFHLILFALFIVNGLHVVVDLYYDHMAFYVLGTVLSVASGVLTIMCLIRQKGSNLDPWIQRLVWGCLAYFVYWFAAGMVFSVFLMIKRPWIAGNPWLLMQTAVQFSPGDEVWLKYLFIIEIIILFGLSIPGLLLVDRHRRAQGHLHSDDATG